MIPEWLYACLCLWQDLALPLAVAALMWACFPAYRATLADVWQTFRAKPPAPCVKASAPSALPPAREVWIWNPATRRHEPNASIDPP